MIYWHSTKTWKSCGNMADVTKETRRYCIHKTWHRLKHQTAECQTSGQIFACLKQRAHWLTNCLWNTVEVLSKDSTEKHYNILVPHPYSKAYLSQFSRANFSQRGEGRQWNTIYLSTRRKKQKQFYLLYLILFSGHF